MNDSSVAHHSSREVMMVGLIKTYIYIFLGLGSSAGWGSGFGWSAPINLDVCY